MRRITITVLLFVIGASLTSLPVKAPPVETHCTARVVGHRHIKSGDLFIGAAASGSVTEYTTVETIVTIVVALEVDAPGIEKSGSREGNYFAIPPSRSFVQPGPILYIPASEEIASATLTTGFDEWDAVCDAYSFRYN